MSHKSTFPPSITASDIDHSDCCPSRNSRDTLIENILDQAQSVIAAASSLTSTTRPRRRLQSITQGTTT